MEKTYTSHKKDLENIRAGKELRNQVRTKSNKTNRITYLNEMIE
jgi:ATP-dependent Lon protease